MTNPAAAIALLQEMDCGPVEWEWDPRRDRYDVYLGPNKPIINISGQLLAMADTNQGAFLSALKHEMEAAMNKYQPINASGPQYISVPPPFTPSVEAAEKTLKQAKVRAKAAAKAERAARRRAKQCEADKALVLDTLREVAQNGDDGARVEAAVELWSRVA